MTRLLIALAALPLACLCWFARRRDERMLRAGAGESDAERDAAETALAATEKE